MDPSLWSHLLESRQVYNLRLLYSEDGGGLEFLTQSHVPNPALTSFCKTVVELLPYKVPFAIVTAGNPDGLVLEDRWMGNAVELWNLFVQWISPFNFAQGQGLISFPAIDFVVLLELYYHGSFMIDGPIVAMIIQDLVRNAFSKGNRTLLSDPVFNEGFNELDWAIQYRSNEQTLAVTVPLEATSALSVHAFAQFERSLKTHLLLTVKLNEV